jgi:hypothetical protein
VSLTERLDAAHRIAHLLLYSLARLRCCRPSFHGHVAVLGSTGAADHMSDVYWTSRESVSSTTRFFESSMFGLRFREVPMPSAADRMIAALDAFVADPTDRTTVFDLNAVTKDFDSLSDEDQERVIPAMFRVMERWPGADLGSPGPLVHAIEMLELSTYGELLTESVRRRPMYLNLWMVNRVLNGDAPDPEPWLGLLRSIVKDPAVSGDMKAQAADYIKYQTGAEPT